MAKTQNTKGENNSKNLTIEEMVRRIRSTSIEEAPFLEGAHRQVFELVKGDLDD